MMRLSSCLRMGFAKYKQAPYQIGLLGQDPDLRGKEIDLFRRHMNRASVAHAGKQMPNFGVQRCDQTTIERNEIETRILRLIRDLQILKVSEVKFDADLRRDLKVDSLNLVALLTSIEHEFTTVFEDNLFQGFKNLNEVVTILMRDPKII